MAEYTSLLSDLSENITNEDLEQLKSACKEDIPEDQSNNITSSKEWFSYLEKNDKLAQGEESAVCSRYRTVGFPFGGCRVVPIVPVPTARKFGKTICMNAPEGLDQKITVPQSS